MGKPTLIISILIIIFVAGILYMKSKSSVSPATTYYQPTPSSTMKAPTPTQTPSTSSLPLTITSPTTTTVSTQLISVSGQTTPNADVFVNDTALKASAQGTFSTTVTLDEGDNTIVIDVNDAEGNHTEKEITVTYMATTQ